MSKNISEQFHIIKFEDQLFDIQFDLVEPFCLAFSMPLVLEDRTAIMGMYHPVLTDKYGCICFHLPKDDLISLFRDRFPFGASEIVVHDLKEWLRFFRVGNGFAVDCGNLRSVRLFAYLFHPPEKSEEESEEDLTLESLVRRYLGESYPLWGTWIRDKSFPEAFYERLCDDARFAYRVWKVLTKSINTKKDADLLGLYHTIELPLVRVLLDMEMRGVRVDRDAAAVLLEDFTRELEHLKTEITSEVGSWINPNSPSQMGYFLAQVSGRPFQGGVDDNTLEEFASRHPAVPLMLLYRKRSRDLHFFRTVARSTNERVYP